MHPAHGLPFRLSCLLPNRLVANYRGQVLEVCGKRLIVQIAGFVTPGSSVTGSCALLPGPTVMRVRDTQPCETKSGHFVVELGLQVAPRLPVQSHAEATPNLAATAASRLLEAGPQASVAQALRGTDHVAEQLQAVAAAVLHLLRRNGLVDLGSLLVGLARHDGNRQV